jgi:hypothetical protein
MIISSTDIALTESLSVVRPSRMAAESKEEAPHGAEASTAVSEVTSGDLTLVRRSNQRCLGVMSSSGLMLATGAPVRRSRQQGSGACSRGGG